MDDQPGTGGVPSTPYADPETFRRAMRHWVAGVTVVTSQFGAARHGMTVSSFTSISLIPPMILVSLESGTRTHELVVRSGIFGVTLLGAAQKEISERFAGRTEHEDDRFAGLSTFSLVSQAPLISGGLAYFDCRVTTSVQAGTSTIFLAEVMAAQSVAGQPPLAYSDRQYFQIVPLENS